MHGSDDFIEREFVVWSPHFPHGNSARIDSLDGAHVFREHTSDCRSAWSSANLERIELCWTECTGRARSLPPAERNISSSTHAAVRQDCAKVLDHPAFRMHFH